MPEAAEHSMNGSTTEAPDDITIAAIEGDDNNQTINTGKVF